MPEVPEPPFPPAPVAARLGVARLGVAPPAVGPGVCATCRGPERRGRPECWACRHVGSVLAGAGHVGAAPLVVPIALFATGDGLHRVLRGYKDAPVADARRHFAIRLTAHVASFFAVHQRCLLEAAATPWDALAVVPSSTRGVDATSHPFTRVVGAVPSLSCVPSVVLVGRERRPGRSGHLHPDPGAFRVDGDLGGRKVLLLDDTWVTGSRARSATAAVEAAGARWWPGGRSSPAPLPRWPGGGRG